MRKLPNDFGKKGYRGPVCKAHEEFSGNHEEYSRKMVAHLERLNGGMD